MSQSPPTEHEQRLNRYELTERLQEEAKKLEGIRRQQFVDQPSICSHCKYAQITRQASKNYRTIRCSVYGRNMPEDIIECNEYASYMDLSLSQMAEIATLIDPRKNLERGYL